MTFPGTSKIRKALEIIRGRYTIDGAGVKLYRVFGGPSTTELTDPFLLLDFFGSKDPKDYVAGFPWHPHRGIETVTYMLKGRVKHEDSTGNKGVIDTGDIQWMTAGSGIYHQEMPEVSPDGEMRGFQLWLNIPREKKMIKPKYRNLRKDGIPETVLDNGVRVKVVVGTAGDLVGPIKDTLVDAQYLDVYIPPETTFMHNIKQGYTSLVYAFSGEGIADPSGQKLIREGELAVYGRDGELISIRAKEKPLRILVLSGRPLEEPIAWYGPIVMNYEYEIREAFRELADGTFIKSTADTVDYE
ncbi:MAG: pirin family protein [Metallosphaera sp.]|uniref:Pirin domain-containing protein n=1 Tax=Metallosphaera cuprina (strain Ar-4) TaxID=1006006 RepID=F4G0V3_METCR|nr:pirin family protein [Metallosphaera cuprina]AEB95912.1 pirin domain-containing protein [Metallosphaera cuprina Ar-4]